MGVEIEDVIDPEQFWKHLQHSKRRVLFLDFDGTLAPFSVDRDRCDMYPGVREILNQIITSGCRLVVISGRSAESLPALLNLQVTPEIWGCHGWERMHTDGSLTKFPLSDDAVHALEEAYIWAKTNGLENFCERKYGCISVHWRGQTPQYTEKLRKKVQIGWNPLIVKNQVEIRSFDGGLSLAAVCRNKGDAVQTVIREEQGGIAAAFLGDDLTDEDGFHAIKDHGIGVLVRSEYRRTAADLWVKPPDGLLGFLSRWNEICSSTDNSVKSQVTSDK